jgi:ubiquinone/menaquinone biosynthesis C-methylase UbiE
MQQDPETPVTQAGGYPETADIETSSDDYARRFSGATGAWMLSIQERTILGALAGSGARSVLDVGGGHGQLAAPLAREGYEVTVIGSAPECRRRVADLCDAGGCRFLVGNLIDLPFPDRSFDAVVSIRLLTHCLRWETLVAELARVARVRVVVEYPTSQSLNAVAPRLFSLKKRIETDTRTFTLFTHDQVEEAFARHGFRLASRRGELFLPLVLHRVLRCRPLSALLEGVCRALGLTTRWGSPVVACFTRR